MLAPFMSWPAKARQPQLWRRHLQWLLVVCVMYVNVAVYVLFRIVFSRLRHLGVRRYVGLRAANISSFERDRS
jgi:hypothetical protein